MSSTEHHTSDASQVDAYNVPSVMSYAVSLWTLWHLFWRKRGRSRIGQVHRMANIAHAQTNAILWFGQLR